MAITAAGLILVFSTAFPAAASRCGPSSQTITRIAGSWSSLSGPIVTAAVDPSGVAWTVGPDARLDHVTMELAPTTTGGATVSSSITLPGSETGLVPIVGDEDVEIRFVGEACHDPEADDSLVEIESAPMATTQPSAVVPSSDSPVVVPARSPGVIGEAARVLLIDWMRTVLRLCRLVLAPL